MNDKVITLVELLMSKWNYLIDGEKVCNIKKLGWDIEYFWLFMIETGNDIHYYQLESLLQSKDFIYALSKIIFNTYNKEEINILWSDWVIYDDLDTLNDLVDFLRNSLSKAIFRKEYNKVLNSMLELL